MGDDPKALMKEGEDALKTGLFKWEADHITAASCFEKAGRILRGRGDGESAMGAFLKAAKSHLSKGGSGYEAAAKAYQQAAQAYPPKAGEFYMKSFELYNANGNVEDAVENMGKAAEALEKAGNTDQALNLYVKVIDMVPIDQHTRAIVVQKLSTVMQAAFRKLVAARKLAEASKCANKLLEIQQLRKEKSPKIILQIVILYLARGDIGAARKLVSSCLEDMEFVRSSEGDCAQDLCDAYERLDSQKIQKLVEGNAIKYLDPQVVYLARELDPAGKTVSVSTSAFGASSAKEATNPQKADLFAAPASKPPPAQKADLFASSTKPNTPSATTAAPVSVKTANPSNQPNAQPKPVAAPAPAAPAAPAPAPQPEFDFDLPDIR